MKAFIFLKTNVQESMKNTFCLFQWDIKRIALLYIKPIKFLLSFKVLNRICCPIKGHGWWWCVNKICHSLLFGKIFCTGPETGIRISFFLYWFNLAYFPNYHRTWKTEVCLGNLELKNTMLAGHLFANHKKASERCSSVVQYTRVWRYYWGSSTQNPYLSQ